MSELETVSTTIGILVACTTVVIGVVNQIVSNRRAEEQRAETQETQQLTLETRQAQLFMQIYNRWNQRETAKAYGLVRYKYLVPRDGYTFDDWRKEYHADVNIEGYADYMTLYWFFEGLGILVKKGLIDISFVEDLFSKRIIWIWENLLSHGIDAIRSLADDPTQYDSIEYLYNELKQRQQQVKAST